MIKLIGSVTDPPRAVRKFIAGIVRPAATKGQDNGIIHNGQPVVVNSSLLFVPLFGGQMPTVLSGLM